MSHISTEQIKHIAKLSRLSLHEEEIKLYSSQLSSILEYVEQLSEVNTDNVEPLSNVTGLDNVIREDVIVQNIVSHEDIKINTPKFDKNNFVVPGVFE